MDQVSTQFHKNVRLLTEIFEPHEEFKKYFKEGMFDKPNTQGFIHVSYYLLKIYYKDNVKDVKDKLQWPVICKQTETKFRNDVKECLMVISKEHLDVSFPAIFPSHLLLAKGTKFMQIMYKLSLIVLRSHLIRDHKLDVLLTPVTKPNPGQESIKIFLKKFTKKQQILIEKVNKDKEDMESKAKNFCKKKNEEKIKLTEKIFKLREKLNEIIILTPTNEVAKKRLKDLEDYEIINAWLKVLSNDFIPSMEKRLESQQQIDERLKSICNILSNLKGEALILNSSNFDQVNIDFIEKFLPSETQVMAYNLYSGKNLNLKNFFGILQCLLLKYNSNHNRNVEKFSVCSSQLEESSKCLKTVTVHLENVLEQIKSFASSELKGNHEFISAPNVTAFNTSITEFDKVLFLPSPPIKVNTFDEGDQNISQNHLKLTPVEGAHKKLFSRHALDSEKTMKYTKEKLPYVQRINFDDPQSFNNSYDKSLVYQKFYAPTKIKSTFKYAEKYSRLFATPKPVTNNSIKMTSSEKSILPSMSKEHCLSFSDSCNVSQEFSQESLLMKPNNYLKSMMENSEQSEEKISKTNNKRRSITDLVERYKNLIQKNKDTP